MTLLILFYSLLSHAAPQPYTEQIVAEAKKQRFDESPEVRKELDRVLSDAFLKKLSDDEKWNKFTDEQVKRLYNENPLVRFYWIEFPAKSIDAQKKIEKIKAAIAKKNSFEKIVMAHSTSALARYGGDSDYRGLNQTPDILYAPLKKMRVGDTVGPLTDGNYFYFAKLIHRKTFAEAPITYLSYLKDQETKNRQDQYLSAKYSKKRAQQ